jgi:hypothetical protein
MHTQVESAIPKAIQFNQFIALSCDEVTTIDNDLWICVHAYVVDCWTKIPILVCVDKTVDGLGSHNLTEVIMNALLKGGGLTKEKLAKKLFCFGKDGINVFQGGKT